MKKDIVHCCADRAGAEYSGVGAAESGESTAQVPAELEAMYDAFIAAADEQYAYDIAYEAYDESRVHDQRTRRPQCRQRCRTRCG